MTRKKAIEAALTAKSKDNGIFKDDLRVAEHAYDAGRIAGLREAARICYRAMDKRDISERARELAKKARGK